MRLRALLILATTLLGVMALSGRRWPRPRPALRTPAWAPTGQTGS